MDNTPGLESDEEKYMGGISSGSERGGTLRLEVAGGRATLWLLSEKFTEFE